MHPRLTALQTSPVTSFQGGRECQGEYVRAMCVRDRWNPGGYADRALESPQEAYFRWQGAVASTTCPSCERMPFTADGSSTRSGKGGEYPLIYGEYPSKRKYASRAYLHHRWKVQRRWPSKTKSVGVGRLALRPRSGVFRNQRVKASPKTERPTHYVVPPQSRIFALKRRSEEWTSVSNHPPP